MVSPAAKNSLGLYYAAKPLSQLEFVFTDKSSTTVKEEKERNYYGEKKSLLAETPIWGELANDPNERGGRTEDLCCKLE